MAYGLWRFWCYILCVFDGMVIRSDLSSHQNGWVVFLAFCVGVLIVTMVISDAQEHM